MPETRITLKMDEPLYRVLVQAARKNRRSLDAEIIVRLEKSLERERETSVAPEGICRITIDWRRAAPEWREALMMAIGQGNEAAWLVAPLIPISEEDEREAPVRSMALPLATQYQREAIAKMARFILRLPGPSPVSIEMP